jgi:hypothetical protein
MRLLTAAFMLLVFGGVAAVSAEGVEVKSSSAIFSEKPDKHYQKGDRVDPFTIGSEKDKEKKTPPEPTPPVATCEGLAASVKALETLLSSKAEDRLSRCVRDCAELEVRLEMGVAAVKADPQRAAKELDQWLDLVGKVERLGATAKRLKARAEIMSEFAALKLSLTGVVKRGRGASTAVVNGDLVREGSVIGTGRGRSHKATVQRIRKRSVLLLYRGVEMELKF